MAAQTFSEATAQALTVAAASQEPSTRANSTSTGSAELEHKRAFLRTFRRWEALFKRKDSSVESDKWLIAEYYKSLGHLSDEGLDRLTECLKETCVFFPTIKECLDLTRPGKWDYAHPFYALAQRNPELRRIAAQTRQLGYAGE